MSTLVLSYDSDIGRAIVDVEKMYNRVLATSRNNVPGTTHFELTQKATWSIPEDVDRVYFAVAIGEGRHSKAEIMLVNSILPIEYLHWFASNAKQDVEFVVFSSQWGSISSTTNARALTYKQSKAALNMGVKGLSTLSFGERKHRWLLLHPGLVQTKMIRGSYPTTPMSPDESARQCAATVDNWSAAGGSTQFLDYRGAEISW